MMKFGIVVLASLMMMGMFALQPVYAVRGTGTLFMYSDSTCTTLLPQVSGGNTGYLLPSTGTTVYVQIKGITETGVNTISLHWNNYKENLPMTVAGGTTGCTAWTVGTFHGASGITITCATTGIVFYGPASKPDTYRTGSNGGADGGHFYGAGTDSSGQCISTTVPEFPLGSLLMIAAVLPAVLLLRRRVLTFRN